MPRTSEDVALEIEQAKLARCLAGRDLDLQNGEHYAIYRRAGVMLRAQKLFDACEFALTTLSGLSTAEFGVGGDAAARDVLREAIHDADEQYTYNSTKRARECREAVLASIAANRARTS